MSTLRIALATPALNAWSETFIAAHRQRLQEVVLTLTEGSLPQRANDELLLAGHGGAGRLRNAWHMRMLGKDRRTLLEERIAGALRRTEAQVLLAEFGPTGEALLPVACKMRVPLVVHFHGYDAHMSSVLREYRNYQGIFAGAAALVVVSRAMEQHLLSLGAPREKLVYNCYGIDVEHFSPGIPSQAAPTFLAVGRFTDKKAPQLTLLAFRQVWLRQPAAQLVMVGDGTTREMVRQMVVAWGMESAVELPGVQKPVQIAERLRGARAFVQHSVTTNLNDMEGTPLAVLEAMACGLPVISTRHAGIPDVVAHGERGLLCAEYDVQGMADHMLRMIDHPQDADAMGLAGRTYAMAHHRVEESVGKLQHLLEQVARC